MNGRCPSVISSCARTQWKLISRNRDENFAINLKTIIEQTRWRHYRTAPIIAAYSCFNSLLRLRVFPSLMFMYASLDAITCCSRRDRYLREKANMKHKIANNASWWKLKGPVMHFTIYFSVSFVYVRAPRWIEMPHHGPAWATKNK